MGLAVTNLHVDIRFTKTSATRKMNWQMDGDSRLHFKKLEFWYQCIAIKWPSAMLFAIPFSVEKAEKWKCAWHNPNLQTQILFLHFLQSPLHMLGLKKLEIHYSQFWQLNLCLSAHSMALKWCVIEFFSHQIVDNNDLLIKSKSNSDF